jgi:hypothetical protein
MCSNGSFGWRKIMASQHIRIGTKEKTDLLFWIAPKNAMKSGSPR